ncbi:hypothetical protein F5148DRAFT_286601 [Russula earlei]|uniref:Uncharacterized protein n=1 Tax=Russula earlei TaxID=71964 RepID=A0ACC0UNY5_9AGAM|nr:hypothetical protein F5148DRAFT_286601 [Russula earlei]
MPITLESLPVELVTSILEELDLASLVVISCLSRRLHSIASDRALNPWRAPILRNLHSGVYESSLKHLSVRTTVPRQNWIEIISRAQPRFLLFEATLPNMKEADWHECFKRRFLPGWQKWKRDLSWHETFKRLLFRVWHRSMINCTSDESWTKYIVLNKNGTANELEASSRNFNPLAIFNNLKLQSNLAHLETHIRLVVQLADVRILALGVLNNPRGVFTVNRNARAFLHPPGIEMISDNATIGGSSGSAGGKAKSSYPYERLTRPLPALSHAEYPFYTPGGGDKRWLISDNLEEEGRQWVGGLMLTAQITSNQTSMPWGDGPFLQDLDLVVGFGRSQYASFTLADLDCIAPWMKDLVTKRIDGPGLGN